MRKGKERGKITSILTIDSRSHHFPLSPIITRFIQTSKWRDRFGNKHFCLTNRLASRDIENCSKIQQFDNKEEDTYKARERQSEREFDRLVFHALDFLRPKKLLHSHSVFCSRKLEHFVITYNIFYRKITNNIVDKSTNRRLGKESFCKSSIFS